MKWLENFFKRNVTPKVDLPPNWLEDVPVAKPKPPMPPSKRPKPATSKSLAPKGVINLAEPARPAQTNRSRGKITTPVPAKKGTKTLDLAGKQDVFNRRSKSIIDMRRNPKG